MAKDKVVLKPTLTASTENIDLSVPNATHCEMCRVDAAGNELPDSEFVIGVRTYDRSFANNPSFKLKKKY